MILHVRLRSWNEKYLDYEIETVCGWLSLIIVSLTWNEKYLDYEIETFAYIAASAHPTGTWNEKHLDYEIETKIWQFYENSI